MLQGRAEEAASLLRPYEDRLSACGPLARLHVMQGELDLAAATIRRALDELHGDRLRESVLLSQLVEIELGRDNVIAAATACDRLVENATASDTPILQAMALLARGRVAAAHEELGDAVAALQTARDALADEERPVLCGAIRYEMARVLAMQGDTAAAISEARAALAIFERVGAVVDADRTTAFLRNLGSRTPARGREARDRVDSLTARQREVLDLLRQGLTNAEIGSRLFISAKTAEHHVGRVLTKLGVRSRAEAAAVAVDVAT
jgi:DNA-binding NarL/FixJ family response regulator